ncbi:Protein of unknown function [Sulfitobacter marinus]|uniref:DUF3306 domain-containing protein n=1 Tax=Sulfitobacter marinus TaxID=394264 RepID=A0A1I6QA76_9RHOB|nr:DUF3306 domain-containing protein [Sulfitobacter marinus]SFS49367.1 Protein of unknown function [Sulfitobacter marinus]
MTSTLSSWSRRRAAVAAEEAALKREADDAIVAEQQAELAEKTDAEILEELGLPDPDALVLGDNVKAFMVKTVPQHLRNRALRSLWRSNPVLACVDGLNDYDDDYLTGSTGQGPIKTGYQVGKGMLAHLLEMERQAAAPAEAALVDADGTDEDEEVLVVEGEVIAATDEVSVDDAQVEEAEDIEQTAPTRRRMQFRFEGQST